MSYKTLSLNCSGKIFFGEIPSKQDMYELKNKHSVDTVWNLTEEFSYVLNEEKEVFSEVLHSPIADYQAPTKDSKFIQNLQEVCLKLNSGSNVFIHCFGGHGRTGMALAALLIKINNRSAKSSLNMTQKICQGPESEIQKEFIELAFV